MAVCRSLSLPTSVLLLAPGCFLRSNAGVRDRHPGARTEAAVRQHSSLHVLHQPPATPLGRVYGLRTVTMQRSGQQDSGEGIQMPGP